MGVSFDRTTEGKDQEAQPPQRRLDDKARLDGTVAPNELGRSLDRGSPERPHSVLVQVIEGEIIPRLFLAHRHRQRRGNLPGGSTAWNDALGDNEAIANLFIGGDSADIADRLRALLDRGIPRERVYVDVLAPVARTLSMFWEEGRCSFNELANGLACVDEVVQNMSACGCKSQSDPH